MYFYEKRYYRQDNEVLVRRYSRSFELGRQLENNERGSGSQNPSNVEAASISRARMKVKILAFSNPDLDGFLTLTNADVPTEEEANRRFKSWVDRVRKKHRNFKFLGVKELQKRGSIHWHLLVNFCPAMTPSQKQGRFNCNSWTFGFSDFAFLDADEKFRLELYLLKYMTKGTERIFKNYYVRSRNLNEIKPRFITTQEPIHFLAENVFYKRISNSFVDNFEIFEYNYNVVRRKEL